MKKTIRFFVKAVLTFLAFIVLYIILGISLPLIGISAKETSNPKTIDMYILTNGVHTDLVLPLKNETIDWRTKLSFSDIRSKSTDYEWVAFGWGDKGFYLNTPTWADLTISTALKAAFWMSESAMHCTFYRTMHENESCIKIQLTEKQYQNLVNYIDTKFDKDTSNSYILIQTDAVYGDHDAFYEAQGTYSFAYTCNTWANYGLKAAEQKYALWTPTDSGIFRHYKQ